MEEAGASTPASCSPGLDKHIPERGRIGGNPWAVISLVGAGDVASALVKLDVWGA